jgi:hypothetical protein
MPIFYGVSEGFFGFWPLEAKIQNGEMILFCKKNLHGI